VIISSQPVLGHLQIAVIILVYCEMKPIAFICCYQAPQAIKLQGHWSQVSFR
jgi:hypothetical protein